MASMLMLSGSPSLNVLQVVVRPDHSPDEMKGICEVSGDQLVYCWSTPGVKRPVSFSVPSGSRKTLVKLARPPVVEQEVVALEAPTCKHEIGWTSSET